jgi:predicted DNA-binding transcriptional regulator AlpA
MHDADDAEEFLTTSRKSIVVERIGLSSTTIWRLERAEKFPKHIQLSATSIGWRACDVEASIAERTGSRG